MKAKQFFKDFISKVLSLMPFHIGIRIKFKYYQGYWPNLSKPVTYNEKVQFRKLNKYPADFVLLSDKLKVREYVRSTVGEKYLIPILLDGGCPSFESISGLTLPYVVKANHNSGPVQIVRDKRKIPSAIKEITKQLKVDYGKQSGELWYSTIERKFLVERLLLDDKGNVPIDYKFHCFGKGKDKVIFIQIDYDRYNEHTRSLYDDKFNILPFSLLYKNEEIDTSPPENYSEMLAVVKKLSEPFNYSRIDLYNLDGNVYFGEVTFAHGSGFEKFSDISYDRKWGDLWEL